MSQNKHGCSHQKSRQNKQKLILPRKKPATYTLIYNKLFVNRIPTAFLVILTAKSDRRFGRLKTSLANPNDLLKTTRF